MDNMIQYAEKNLHTFAESPFNEVDSLIFSWLVFLRWEAVQEDLRTDIGVPLRDFFRAECFEGMTRLLPFTEDSLRLLTAVVASPRFRQVLLYHYRHDGNAAYRASQQFGAVTFRISDKLAYVAFRGTDLSLAGWREDLELALTESIPAQILAKKYLNEVADDLPGDILVGGHSKGGNLAVYAAAKCVRRVQDRLRAIYSHDGPGFLSAELKQKCFVRVRERIHKTVPQSSLVGMIFEQEGDYKIVRSNQLSLSQHNPFSWQVEEGSFVYMQQLTPDAKVLYHKLNNWIKSLSDDEIRRFIDGVFLVMEKTGINDFSELGSDMVQRIPAVIKSIWELDGGTRLFLMRAWHLWLLSSSTDERFRDKLRKYISRL